MRIEKDKLGEMPLADETLYGIQSARAKDNFALDYKKTNPRLIYAIVKVKKAAALTYDKLGIGKEGVYPAIVYACDKILSGEADDQFITDALQGGAGTSTHMNVNEVIANLALRKTGRNCGQYEIIHPLDDVNRGQSTNDVYPTALRIAAIELLRELSAGCAKLQQALQEKENEFDDIKNWDERNSWTPCQLRWAPNSGLRPALARTVALYKSRSGETVNIGDAVVCRTRREEIPFRRH